MNDALMIWFFLIVGLIDGLFLTSIWNYRYWKGQDDFRKKLQ
jgi:hypothetical protein